MTMMDQQQFVSVLAVVMVVTCLQLSSVICQPHHGQQHQQSPSAGHDHGHHGRPLEFASEIHNADHILEHLQNVVSTKTREEMTEEELEFHYFKLHDYDNNNKLDGVEIGKALTHFHDEGEAGPGTEPPRLMSDAEIANIVDSVIQDNDENTDGYIEYLEFKRRQRAAHRDTVPEPPSSSTSPPAAAAAAAHTQD